MEIRNVADLVNPDTGKTWREENLAREHNIPVGTLVELDTGVRLFVTKHTRDCDGSPLYSLGADENCPMGYVHGYLEESLNNPTTPPPTLNSQGQKQTQANPGRSSDSPSPAPGPRGRGTLSAHRWDVIQRHALSSRPPSRKAVADLIEHVRVLHEELRQYEVLERSVRAAIEDGEETTGYANDRTAPGGLVESEATFSFPLFRERIISRHLRWIDGE